MMEDKRIVYAELGSVRYPLCLTVMADEKIKDTFGSMEAMVEAIQTEGKTISETAKLACILIEGGVGRTKALAWMAGEEVETPKIPDSQMLMNFLTIKDAKELADKLFESIYVSRGVTVEAQPEANEVKNAETTQ